MHWAAPALLAGAFLAGCSGSDEKSPNGSDNFDVAKSAKQRLPASADPSTVGQLTHDNTDFAFELMRTIAPQGNFFYSPHSISIALAMTYAGAAGSTKTEMATALHFSQPDAELSSAFNTLDQKLAARGKNAKGVDGAPFRLTVSNAAWAQHDYTFLPTYLDTLAQSYGAGINLMDFVADSEGCRKTINSWIADQTEDRIPELLAEGSLNAATRLVLTNAVYFNASWDNAFEVDATQDGSFETLAGGSVTVPLMHQAHSYAYGEGAGYKAVDIDYDGDEVSMLVILPDAGTFEQFEQSLDATKLEAIEQSMSSYEVNLTLPRFELRSREGLADPLKTMGMPTAFTGDADFSAMNGSGGLFIQDVIHEAFVKVNEAGTEAAAATAVTMGATSVPEVRDFEATRPFLFVIRDRETNASLFVGRIVDPSLTQ